MTVGTARMIDSTVLAPDVTRIPTVSTTYLQGVIDFARVRGVSRNTLLRHAGVRDADLANLDARHPLEWLIALLRSGAELAPDPAFALHFGQYVPCDQVSLAAPMGRAARNVDEALALVNRYTPLSIDFPALAGRDRYAFVLDGTGLWLCDNRPADGWPEITELVFARMVQGIRRIQRTDVVRALFVRHTAPPYRHLYGEIFGVPVHFGSERNAILLDPSYQYTELVPAPAHVTRILVSHADAQLAALEQQRGCKGRLEAELRKVLHTGEVSVAHMTRRLAMSRQTLYRKLKAEGVTYDQVLVNLRREIAEQALSSGSASVREVAALVGFTDAAAFSRAFKRWTGNNPSEVNRAAKQY